MSSPLDDVGIMDFFSLDTDDIQLRKEQILAEYETVLSQSRPTPAILDIYKNRELACIVRSPGYGNVKDQYIGVVQMMQLSAAARSNSSILALHGVVEFEEYGEREAVVIIVIGRIGALAEAYPYEINEDGSVGWDTDAALSTNASSFFEQYTNHIVPVFAMVEDSPFSPTTTVRYLSSKGFEIHWNGDYDEGALSSNLPGDDTTENVLRIMRRIDQAKG